MNSDLIKYYHDRAKEYEKIYSKPERQEDLKTSTAILKELFTDKAVLEIACGTGYWTQRIAETAKTVLATDVNASVIEIGRNKNYQNNNVRYEVADLYDMKPDLSFDSLFAGFIWSHIALQELNGFLNVMNGLIRPGGQVVIMDNNFVSGSSTPVDDTDEHGNTFQARTLKDGTCHRVLKNFPSGPFLEKKLTGVATDTEVIQLEYFWILKYRTLVS
jgi:ubiquinone/menaquinone biosynthesis C-methylase UbiE